MQKIKNIEILKIIGCFAILMLHFFSHYLGKKYGDISVYHQLKIMTSNGQKAVDLFFILSGCFFAMTFNKNISIWEFIKRKIIRLYPVLIFVMLCMFILSLFKFTEFDIYSNILCLFAINGTFLSVSIGSVYVFWYVSVMFWFLLLYFYLSKYYEQKNINLFAFLAIFFCYGILIHAKGGKINGSENVFSYIFQDGSLRGLGGISLGYLLGNWYKNNIEGIKNYVPTFKQKLFFTFLEFICLYFIINNLMFNKLKFENDIIYIISFAVIIFLFLLNKGYISKLLDKDIIPKLSRYTYSIYMTHAHIIMIILTNTLWQNTDIIVRHPILNIILLFSAAILFGILTYHLIEEPCTKWLKNKYCK